jgi:phosphoglycolate phosphatase-like HAD superfamily hydrolase
MINSSSPYQAILWDFDGVIMNSNPVRDSGFSLVLKDFPEHQVEVLLKYHRKNGGLSRYVKFRYFFEQVRGEQVTDEIVLEYAQRFSVEMMKHLTNPLLLIEETVNYIRTNYINLPMFIVSGSDQNELRQICNETGINTYFKGIFGSPTPKKQLVRNIIELYNLIPSDSLLIGDSINDFEAAEVNGLHFMAYNNPGINHLSSGMIYFR